MKGYIPNSKKEIKFSWHFTYIAFGYSKEIMDWRHGHITQLVHYYLFVFNLRISQAFIKLPKL